MRRLNNLFVMFTADLSAISFPPTTEMLPVTPSTLPSPNQQTPLKSVNSKENQLRPLSKANPRALRLPANEQQHEVISTANNFYVIIALLSLSVSLTLGYVLIGHSPSEIVVYSQ